MTIKKMDSTTGIMTAAESLDCPRPVQIPPIEEVDAVDGLLHRMYNQISHHAASSFAYQDLEEYDHIGAEALHRVVEDLQFGHDLRL